MKEKFYITTTLAYVNANLHIGHAAELIRADILVRYKKAMGFDVVLNTGTDEHGQKILNTAKEQGLEVQEFVDEQVIKFKEQVQEMNVDYTNWVRTTDEHHQKSAQEFWRRCEASGDIYKKIYKIKYCVGCEAEKTDSELVNGECPLHPGKKIEEREEENYFFKFSNYQEKLLDLYKNNSEFIIPSFRQNEIYKFVERGLEDFSISRLKEKMPWGISVPNDENHVMYVWFDALVNYVSTIGWPDNTEEFEKWWPVFQVAGKDNLRFQSAMWQAMLMSAGLTPSKQIHIFGFINSGGQKMSKSLENVINPSDIVDEYGTDALRYLVARHINMYEDSDITMEKIKDIYNAHLANGLGNLVSRILKMTETNEVFLEENDWLVKKSYTLKFLEKFQINKAMDEIWERISQLDEYIQRNEPFKLIKTDEQKAKEYMRNLKKELLRIAVDLIPFMPETAQKIQALIKTNKSPDKSLFQRK
ncbi:MAG: methionine--tRNA ligase [Candidatus Pacebacteria bacterium]|nr:methionine--tRNA ligase [Candidatus Paceibacterota bacterium]